VIKFEQFNKKNENVHAKYCTTNASIDNLVDFPTPDRQALVSAEEVGHWVDRLMKMTEDSSMSVCVEKKDDCLELAQKLVNQGLI